MIFIEKPRDRWEPFSAFSCEIKSEYNGFIKRLSNLPKGSSSQSERALYRYGNPSPMEVE